jgi:hypothetical protein
MGLGEQRRKRHHYVPESYLKRWANAEGMIAARMRSADSVFTTKPLNVALESNLYTIYASQSEPDDVIERALSDEIEGPATELLQELAEKPCPKRKSDDRRTLSRFLAIQLIRTPDHISQFMFPVLAVEYAQRVPVTTAIMRRYLAEVHLAVTPSESEVLAATDWVNGLMAQGPLPDKGEALRILFKVALEKVAPILCDKAWSVEIDPRKRFITSDLPVSKYWSPSKRKSYQGVGVQDATEIRFPIDPAHLLVMRPRFPSHRVVVSDERVEAVNRGTASRSYRFIISNIDNRPALLNFPFKGNPATLRFNEAPLFDDYGKTRSDVIHLYVEYIGDD